MGRFRVIEGDEGFINHEHFCLLDELVDKKSFICLCPIHIKKRKDISHDDFCDECKYISRIDFFKNGIEVTIDKRIIANSTKKYDA